jgi:copper transport protein
MLLHSLSRQRLFGPRRARVSALLLASAAVGATLGWAAVHTRLEASVPAAGDVLTRAPQHFELKFSGPVNAALSSLLLVTPYGDSVSVSLRTAADERVLIGASPELTDGNYFVLWRTVSADGHPVSGEFEFGFAGASDETTDTEGGAGAADVEEPPDYGVAEPEGTGAARGEATTPPAAVVLLAGLGLLCLLGFAGLLWYSGSLPLMAEPRIGRTASALGWGALFLLGAELARWTWAVVPAGTGLAGLASALGTGTGLVGLSRIGLLGLALVFLRQSGRVAAVLALASVLLGAAAGHAATISPGITIPANAVHLGAVSIWFGGLLLLVVAPEAPTDGSGSWQFVAVARAVSAAALLSVVLIAASGIIQSAWLVGDLEAFTGTTYGRGVLAKWMGLAVLMGFGALHRFRVMPALERDGNGRGLRRTVRLETIVMLAVVMVAAWLARVSPPAAH